MNILLIDSHQKDGQYISGYLKLKGHQCEWLRKLDDSQALVGTLIGSNSAWQPRTVALAGFDIALVEGQLFHSPLGIAVAVKLAEANIIRVALGGVEGSTKLTKEGVINFAINKSVFYEQMDELLTKIGSLVFETNRRRANTTLITRASDFIHRKLKRFRSSATH